MIKTSSRQLITTLANGCGVVILTEDEYNALATPNLTNYITINQANIIINNGIAQAIAGIDEIIDDIVPI